MVTIIFAIRDFQVDSVALRSNLISFKNNVEAKRDHVLEKSNFDKMKNKLLK